MFSNEPASLLITGTTCAPPFTGNVPPSTKQFCTSTTINADLASGLMVAANDGRTSASAAVDARKILRDRPDAVRSMERSEVGKSLSLGRRVGGGNGRQGFDQIAEDILVARRVGDALQDPLHRC